MAEDNTLTDFQVFMNTNSQKNMNLVARKKKKSVLKSAQNMFDILRLDGLMV